MPVKREVRVVGFDDVPFERSDAKVPVVGVAMRGGQYVEAILRTEVERDGDDATDRLAACVEGYRGRANLVAVLLQNLMVAGFNTVDALRLHDLTGLPVIAVARGKPDLEAVKSALHSIRIPNGRAKWARIERVAGRMRSLQGGRATMTPVGLREEEARELLKLCTVRGLMPEPLRIAHLIGAGWVLGQSKGS
ncbi:MAG TPA: DUF99 family protein [Candidatus Thermoplasmatota archaeon]|nr:DUF99 family protein [Candidatus Thermoplasmatota archaeon]